MKLNMEIRRTYEERTVWIYSWDRIRNRWVLEGEIENSEITLHNTIKKIVLESVENFIKERYEKEEKRVNYDS